MLRAVETFDSGASSAFALDESLRLHLPALEGQPFETLQALKALSAELVQFDFSDRELGELGYDVEGWRNEQRERLATIRAMLMKIEGD